MVNLWYTTIQRLDYRSEKRSPPRSDRRAVLDDLKVVAKKRRILVGKQWNCGSTQDAMETLWLCVNR